MAKRTQASGGQRQERVAEQIRQVLSELLMAGSIGIEALQGAGLVSFTEVRMSPDLHQARVFTSIFPPEPEAVQSVMEGFQQWAPKLRSMVAQQVRLRHAPELRFVHDDSIERGARIESLIEEIHQQDEEREPGPQDEGPEDA